MPDKRITLPGHESPTTRLVDRPFVAVAVIAGCSGPTSTDPTTTPSATETSTASAILSAHDLDGKSGVEVVDTLDRQAVGDRPKDLIASVRPGELVVSADGEEESIPPSGRDVLSLGRAVCHEDARLLPPQPHHLPR